MLDQTKLKFYRFLSAILLVALLSMSGVMYVSAHGGDVTLIHACMTNRTGAVRIVSATTTCDANKETALDWGIQGPKGDKGDTGDTGLMGPQGPQGAQGIEGPAGAGINRADTYSVNASVEIAVNGTGGTSASCNDSNDVLLSGGFHSAGPELDVYRSVPFPYFLNQTWAANAFNDGALPATLTVYALCLSIP